MRKKNQREVRVSGREQMAQKYLVLVLRETGIQQTCKLQSRSVATTGPPQHGHTAPAPSLFITFFLISNTWNMLIFVFFFFLYFHHWYLIPWCLYCWSRNIYIYMGSCKRYVRMFSRKIPEENGWQVPCRWITGQQLFGGALQSRCIELDRMGLHLSAISFINHYTIKIYFYYIIIKLIY